MAWGCKTGLVPSFSAFLYWMTQGPHTECHHTNCACGLLYGSWEGPAGPPWELQPPMSGSHPITSYVPCWCSLARLPMAAPFIFCFLQLLGPTLPTGQAKKGWNCHSQPMADGNGEMKLPDSSPLGRDNSEVYILHGLSVGLSCSCRQ